MPISMNFFYFLNPYKLGENIQLKQKFPFHNYQLRKIYGYVLYLGQVMALLFNIYLICSFLSYLDARRRRYLSFSFTSLEVP